MKYCIKDKEVHQYSCFGCVFMGIIDAPKCHHPIFTKEGGSRELGCYGKYIYRLATRREIQRFRMKQAAKTFRVNKGA